MLYLYTIHKKSVIETLSVCELVKKKEKVKKREGYL